MVSGEERPTRSWTHGGESCTSNARSSSSSPSAITPKRMAVRHLKVNLVLGLSYGATDPHKGIPSYEVIRR